MLLLLSHCNNRQQSASARDESANEIDTSEVTKLGEDTDLKTRLQAVYQKRFGVPISEIEVSIAHVLFKRFSCHCCWVSVIRTADGGANAQYGICRFGLLELELSTVEWLDFINTLYKLRIHEWHKARRELFGEGRIGCAIHSSSWKLEIFFFNNSGYDDYMHEYGINNIEKRVYEDACRDGWPNWKEFNEIIDNMVERIKTEGRSVTTDPLEYRIPRFGP